MDKNDVLFLQKLCSSESAAVQSQWQGNLENIIKYSKAELHCHLAGAIRPETLQHLARNTPNLNWSYYNRKTGYSISKQILNGSLRDVKRCLEYRKKQGSLADYIATFFLPKAVLATESSLRRVAFEVCEDNYHEGVRYLEIRFNPWLAKGRIKLKNYIKALACGLKQASAKYPQMEAVLLLSFIKNCDPDIANKILDESLEVNDKPPVNGLIKGVDSIANEIGFTPTRHAALFKRARNSGLSVVCHAGESFSSLEDGMGMVEDAVDILGAKRIGHGLAIGIDVTKFLGKKDLNGKIYDQKRVYKIAEWQKRLRKSLATQNILIEVCPSSNIQTGNVPSLKEHPIKVFLADNIPVAICTDNRWVSHTKLSWEITRTAKAFDFDKHTIEKIVQTPFRYKLENLTK